MSNVIQEAKQLGQSIWLDYIRRGLLRSGELKQLVETGITGLTANPTILEKAIVGSTDYDDALVELARRGKTASEIYEALAIEDIRAAADLMRSAYDATAGADGYPCLEISPLVAYDTDKTVAEASRLFRLLDRPNVMVKVPATPQGIPAIRYLIGRGVNVNVTLIFSPDYYYQVREAYVAGLEDLVRRGGNPAKVSSVASFFLSRIDTSVDSLLEERIKAGQEDLRSLLGKAAIACARLAYRRFKEAMHSSRFLALKAAGAHPQRLLWASTGTKNPAYSDVVYVEPLIGADTVNTMPLATLQAFLDHGKAEDTIEKDPGGAERVFQELGAAGINLRDVTDTLLAEGVKAFSESYEKLLAGIEKKKDHLLGSEKRVGTSLGGHEGDVRATVDSLNRNDVVRRVWRKDYTVWGKDPTEIIDRLGWLTVTDYMHEQVPSLLSFAGGIREAGFRHVVLLGMGGSSLGAEVLRQVFGSAPGYPQLIVLDSTVPAAVKAVSDAVDAAHTLFIVSSKSGTTVEPLILYRYFRERVAGAAPGKTPGNNFVAITDAGTPLVALAEKEGFRRVFVNPADIGGRYSVLSFFGLLPAALIGVDIQKLLERADDVREDCASCVPGNENRSLWLGASMATLAGKGRDKLSLVTSPSVASFGLWAEQLIAESTGKKGKGVVPVAGEPLLPPENYGKDRFFVHLRLKEDDNAAADAAVAALHSAGQPVALLSLQDKYDLGAEFYRWEFATAIAGAVLGVNPFEQPDVLKAKEATQRLLKAFVIDGRPPRPESAGLLGDLFEHATEGKYLAIMAYLHGTPELDAALGALRQKIMTRYHMAVTVGYGPRFLHSTGQMHKGGPDNGLFLQLTANHMVDIQVPGEPYTFGVVADAQAMGDLQALQAAGRRVVRIHLAEANAALIRGLIDEIDPVASRR